MKEYQDQIKKTKENIELSQQMLREIEEREQKKFEKEFMKNTEKFWTYENR